MRAWWPTTMLGLLACGPIEPGGTPTAGCDEPDAVRYLDADGDGAGADASAIPACDAPEDWVETGGDCDDADPRVYPGADEVCDGLDNDCDPSTPDAGLTFEDTDGLLDYAPLLASSSPTAPVLLTLEDPGTLHVCAGTWFAGIAVQADVEVRGHGSPTLDGGGALGGIVVEGAHRATVTDLTIANPGLVGSSGAGLYCEGGEIVGSGLTIATPDGASTGGSAYIRDGCRLELAHSRFHGPSGAINSGHLTIASAEADLTDVRFSHGLASAGGALAVRSFVDGPAARLTCTDCIFEGNESGGEPKGGAILVSGSDVSVHLVGGALVDNIGDGTITIQGGDATTQVTFEQTTFAGNTGDPGADIAVCDGLDDCARYYLSRPATGSCDGYGCAIE